MSEPQLIHEFEGGLHTWLAKQAAAHGLQFLLAHADDGVIWGRLENGKLKTSGEAFPEITVELRESTLQQARLFGEAGELLIWRVEGGFAHRFVGEDDKKEAIDEDHWLWGNAETETRGFTLMREGQQGMLHAVPVGLARGSKAQLKVRHVLATDKDGQAHIAYSRLVDIDMVKDEEGNHER